MITFLASILIWLMFFGLIVLWVIDGRVKKETVLHAVFACLVAWIIAESIKYFFPTPRPFETNGLTPLTTTIPEDGAFPSSHTAVGLALAVSILRHHKKLGILYLIMAFLVGTARILANVHYPVDIAGGAVLGALVALLTQRVHLFKLLKTS